MIYGGPCYSRNGEIEVGFASQKNLIGLYILRTDVTDVDRDLPKGRGVGLSRGCSVTQSPKKKNDITVVKKLLKAT